MHDFDHDLVVIGGGSGGVRAARVAASLGARVVLIEGQRLGGTCVNVGCVPKKLMVFAAGYGDALRDMGGYGWQVEGVRFDWPTLCEGRDKEVARLNRVYRHLLEDANVKVVEGWAEVIGPHSVRVGDRVLTSRYLLVAPGGKPRRTTEEEVPGSEHALISDDIFTMEELPRRMVVVGGGYIACELACVMKGLGVDVSLVHRGTGLLRGFDECLRHELANELRMRGIHLRLSAGLDRIERGPDGLVVTVEDERIETDAVLQAIGRIPNTAGLGLESAGVQLTPSGAIAVDDTFCTTAPSVYAIGDAIDRLQLTPVALAEGTVVAHNLFAGEDRRMEYRDVPTAVFTSPPLATVGLTEQDARKVHGHVKIFKSTFTPLRHKLTGREERVLVKLVVDGATDRVLGVHVMGEEAGEIVQGFAVAIKCHATKAQLDSTIGIHPTIAEELVTLRREWVPVA
ncbi:MAG: glutathione-disulfide reductase [Myxococcales bacterium]|nr:glutathione-disulfide reductase [Myxococcales bacterium]